MNWKSSILFVFVFVVAIAAMAQDIHFSQHYMAPFNINPANTGLFEGDHRAAAIHRSQWASVQVPFTTSAIALDTKMLQGKIGNDYLGVGLNLFTDNVAKGTLTSNAVSFSAAYHKFIDEDATSSLTFGIQAGYMQRTISFSDLTFENQWNDVAFDKNLATGEGQTIDAIGYPDFHAGLVWASEVSGNVYYTVGFSALHLTSPSESFIQDKANKLGRRFVFHGSLDYHLNEKLVLLPKLVYFNQSKAQELNLSTLVGYHLQPDKVTLYGGASYRMSTNDKNFAKGPQSDALIVLTGIAYNNIRVGFSYDVNISRLSELSRGKGAYEISLVYIGLSKAVIVKKQVPCIRI